MIEFVNEFEGINVKIRIKMKMKIKSSKTVEVLTAVMKSKIKNWRLTGLV